MTLKRLFGIFVCFIFSGCWFSDRQIPLPQDDAEYPPPSQKALKFSAPKKFKWNVVSVDSIHRGQILPFDISNLPFQPFNPAGFNPLPNPAIQTAFHYNTLPDTVLNLDNIPSEPLDYKSSLLGRIKKTTLGQPILKASTYHTFFQYNEGHGLPGQTIQAILHTRDGLCWIKTNEGLCILNGESLEIIPNNLWEGYFMAEDTLGQVWVETITNGIFVFNRKSGTQKQVRNFPFAAHIRIDKKGFIWLCTFSDGIYRINPDQKTFKHITTKNGLSSNHVDITFEDREGRIWIGYDKSGVDILDFKLKKIKKLSPIQGFVNKSTYCISENKTGDIYVGGYRKGIEIFNIQKETYKHLDSAQGIEKTQLFAMLEDDEGHMWVGTDSSGIYILNHQADSILHIGTNEGLEGGVINSLSKDAQQQMYVGTQSGGLDIFPPDHQIAHHLSTKEGFLDDNVWGFLEDSRKRLWIGSYGGVNIITPDQKIWKLQILPAENRNDRTEAIIQTGPEQFAMCGPTYGLILIDEANHTLEKIGIQEGLPSVNLRNITQDEQGNLWIGTNDRGIILFDPKKRTIRYLNQDSGLSFNHISEIQEVSQGEFWISTYGGGIENLNLNNNTISTYSSKEGLSNDQVLTILKDDKKRYWIATENGLNLLDPVKGTNTIFTVPNGMPSNSIYSLLKKEGRIYAGTGNGLTIIEEKEIHPYGSKESYWDLQTYGKTLGFPIIDFNRRTVIATQNGRYWWGIRPGMNILDAAVFRTDSSPKPIQVTGIDLLGKDQYFINPGLAENVDTLWNENKDSFYLKGSFKKLNTDQQEGIEWESLSSINLPIDLSLPSNRNYIRFHFGDFLPQNAEYYKYRYILDGVDKKWSPVTDQSVSENYNNIPPGYYTFRVSAKKGFGVWSEPSVYHFRIRPPWWLSWWAELFYLFIFLGLLRFWVRYRSRQLQKENMMLERKITERTTALTTSLENLRQAQGQLIQAEKMASLGELTAGIAHEIQNPLNFVNNFSEVNTELIEDVNKALERSDVPEAKEILKDLEMNMGKITFHGKRADAIVKGMLLHSRANSGQRIPTDINALADEYLRLSFHGLRARDKSFNAQFTMNLDEKLEEVMLVQQDIGRVFLNLFNNAFYSVTEKKKLAPETYEPTVTLSTKRQPDSVEIRIRDNGVGIPKKLLDKIYQPFFTTKPAGQGTGLGLSLSYDIITKEHGGKIDVETKENEFTEFIIELPFQA